MPVAVLDLIVKLNRYDIQFIRWMVVRLLKDALTLIWIPGPGPSHFVGINCPVLPPTVIMKYSVLSEWSYLVSQNKTFK
jgi:hypothetical protein